MDQITLRLREDTIDALDDEAEDAGVSRSEYIRDVIESRHDTGELRDEIENLETTIQRLENEKRALIEDRQYTQELEVYVEKEQAWRNAGLVGRAKWWLFGPPEEVES